MYNQSYHFGSFTFLLLLLPISFLVLVAVVAEESLRALHITTGSLEKAKQELARSQLVLSEDDVQSVLNGDKTLKQARDDSATAIAVELKSPKGPATSERGMDLGWGILYGPPKLHHTV
jgi:hypothetical protein